MNCKICDVELKTIDDYCDACYRAIAVGLKYSYPAIFYKKVIDILAAMIREIKESENES